MQNNEAYSGAGVTPGMYFVNQSAGMFNSVQGSEVAMTAAQVTSSAFWVGTIGTVATCLLL